MHDLVLSQEERPQIHLTQGEISRKVGTSQTFVNEIADFDVLLKSKCFKKRRATKLTTGVELSKILGGQTKILGGQTKILGGKTKILGGAKGGKK